MKLKSFGGYSINDGTNFESILDASTYGLPGIGINLAQRQNYWPLIGGIERPGKQIIIDIYIRNTGALSTYQKLLAQYFDPDDETPKMLVAEDDGGGNDRYVMGICQALDEVPFSAGIHFVATVQIHGDVFWREVTPTAASAWNITATGQQKIIANNGEMDCYPKITIRPTSAKTGSWPYKLFVALEWRTTAAIQYPVEIAVLDTRIASTNFALASGDDLRVWIDGVEVNRWLTNPNTAVTDIWCNVDFESNILMTLAAGINNSVTEFTVNQAISGMPDQGIVYINSEVITYTSKSNADKTFKGCARGANGSTAAAHSTGATVFWIQHDIWILYGNASAGSPPSDSNYEPMIYLPSSSNTTWDYNDFAAVAKPNRTGQWVFAKSSDAYSYGGDRGAAADPFVELGILLSGGGSNRYGRWSITNPCGITVANFQSGEYYKNHAAAYAYTMRFNDYTGWLEVTLISTGTLLAWTNWSRSETFAGTAPTAAGIQFNISSSSILEYFEASDVTLTLDSAKTPISIPQPEMTSYFLDCAVWNMSTVERIELTINMALNEDLIVDTDKKTVLKGGANQFQALSLPGGVRRDWLKLQPGNNTLQFNDTGTNGVTITITYEERFYD